jgi:hypothetical protein
MNITVIVKHVYGNRTIYPACEKSKLLAALNGTKTLTDYAIAIIKKLGYTITVKPETI